MSSTTITSATPPAAPSLTRNPQAGSHTTDPPPAPALTEAPDPLLDRYLTTPLFFASFLFSFLLVDNRNRSHTHAHAGRTDAQAREEPWFWRAKHRKLARLEIGEALELRHVVVAGMVVGMAVGGVGVWWGLRWAWGLVVGLLWRMGG